MSRVVGFTSIAFAVAIVAVQSGRRVEAGGSSPCSVAFSDRTGDLITSDGQGTYADDGKSGSINCAVGGGNNIVLGLGARTARRFRGSYSGLIQGSSFTADAPTGAFSDGTLVNIHDVASMPVGFTKLTQAHFGRANGLYMHWCGSSPDEPPCTYSWGSLVVAVSRPAKRTWLVTTDAPSGYETTVGDEAILADNTGASPIAKYHLPFQLTVDCPKCR